MIVDYPWRCPLTGAPLRRQGERLTAPGVAYAIVDGIAILTAPGAQGAGLPASPVGAAREAEIADEVLIYDRLAAVDRDRLAQARRRLLGRGLDAALRAGGGLGSFPDPIAVWVDSVGSADTQAVAYRHLAPVHGMRVLQLGGSGSHVIKALLAGAAEGVLLSPSLEEVRLGRALADDVGVGGRFVGVVAIGELMPLLDGSVDRVYGGGCLHHTAVELSVPEVARVLAPGGRAAFVDPRDNVIYRGWSALMGAQARFCGDEEGTHDHPMDVIALVELARSHFGEVRVFASGGPLRYGVVFAARTLGIAPSPAQAARWFERERRVLAGLGLGALFGNFALCLSR